MLVPKIKDLKNLEHCNKEKNIIKIDNIDEVVELYTPIDINNAKEVSKLVKQIESLVRRSPEYTEFIRCLKQNFDITSCIFHPDVNIAEVKHAKIEFHHYPFTLYDIVYTVLSKHLEQSTIINPYVVSEEVMLLHYQLKVGLVPLSKTMHELAHAGKKFINLSYVTQSYLKFISEYSRWISPELIMNWHNLQDLSKKEDEGELEEDNILEEVELVVDMGIEKPTAVETSLDQDLA